jgi:hypothetical protein
MKPTELVSVLLEGRPLPLTWELAVWGPDLPGYAQVDMVDAEGVNHGSTDFKKLAAQGYDIPDISRLPSGKYTADLRPMVKVDGYYQPARSAVPAS